MRKALTADINIPNGTEVKISTVASASWLIPFRPFGKKNHRYLDSVDAVDCIYQFSVAEMFLFKEVYIHAEEDSKVTLRLKSYSPAERAKLKRAIPLWIKKGLLKRIKRERYMVNPWFLVPLKDEQQTAILFWSAL